MFKISREQMSQFSLAMQEAFTKRMVRHLQEHFSEELKAHVHQQGDLELLVRRGLVESKSFGVVHEPDVKLYIECMVLLHPDFASDPRLPWARKILERVDLSGAQKMDRVHDHLVFGTYQGLQ